jgi:metallo-beta-lactamase class B
MTRHDPILPIRKSLLVLAGLSLFSGCTAAPAGPVMPPAEPAAPDLATACSGRDGWSEPAPPAHIYGNTWFVGTCGITALLVTSDAGHVLIDGATEQAAPLIAASVEALGFRLADVKWIVSSHEHHDHVGGLAELQRLTGAKVAAGSAAAPLLSIGGWSPDDPQAPVLEGYPPVTVTRILADGEALQLGPIRLTMVESPAHSPGSASWTWTSCEAGDCQSIAYADSLTTISADGYRFAQHPQRVQAVHAGLDRVATLTCDILLTPHPSASGMFERMAGRQPLRGERACTGYAEKARSAFAARLDREARGVEP